MKFKRHKIIIPESHSFIIGKLDLSINADTIHSHRNYELNFILNGVGRRFVGGNISMYGPGDLVLIGPNLPHGWEVDNIEDNPMSITVHFHEDLFDFGMFQVPEFELLHNLLNRSRSGIYFKEISYDEVRNYLEQLLELQGFDSIIQVLQILRYLTLVHDTKILSTSDFVLNEDMSESKRINRVYDYVFHNFQKGIKLKDVAELVNLSESAFCTYFKKSVKKSFFTFLKEIKIGYACKLLSDHPDRNISQICFESGFNNLANFNRQFREITFLSPREYRSKYTI